MPLRVVIFLTIFIDLIGFGIVLPMLPIYAEHFGANGLMIGLIVASFSIMQVIFSPFWGRLSDRIGRRPVILISVAAGTLSYALFALGSSREGNWALWLILLSRIFAGTCGGNINVAQAYIADITPSQHRTAGMGLVGVAFSLGLICGPAIGSFSARWGLAAPAVVATGLSLTSLILAACILKESHPPARRSPTSNVKLQNRWHIWRDALRQPLAGKLYVFLFIATFCFGCYEVTLGLLAERNLHYDATHIGYFFAYHGLITALAQGLLLRRLTARFGEARIITVSFVGSAIALFAIPWANSVIPFVCAITFNSLAVSLNRPTTLGLISRLTPPDQQGELLGVGQSMSAGARIISPLCCMTLFSVMPCLPFLICGLIATVTIFLVARFAKQLAASSLIPPATVEEEEPPPCL